MKKVSFKGNEFIIIKGAVHPDYSYATFEEEEISFRNKYWNVKSGDVVFDVGSSYGSYALSACAMGATVYAFEPEKTVFTDLVKNVNINGWERKCFPQNIGLWSSSTTVDMKKYAPHWPQYTISSDYKVKTIDEIVEENKLTKLDWLKIDVEGAEIHVLKGALDTIKKFHPELIVESHIFLDSTLTNNIKELITSVHNYKIEEIDRNPCVMVCAHP